MDIDDYIYLHIDGVQINACELFRPMLNSDNYDCLAAYISGFLEGRRLLREKTHEKK